MSIENGNGRIHLLNGSGQKLDAQGRVLKHNATVKDVHEIVAEETAKVHEYYLNQIPPFVARMIQDALLSYGLIKMTDEATQSLAATPEAPVVSENTGGDTPAADSSATVPTDSEGPEAPAA